jgi:LmbE family N-acetylglucosaminyl deacetylase
MLLETDLVPYSVSMPVGERVVVLAPHPDDETLGMGGSLRLLAETGKKIKVVVLTGGEKADTDITDTLGYASIRQLETLRAFKVLGVTEYEFLGFPDRELLRNKDRLEEAIRRIIDDFRPDVIYSPSIIELNPDHRAAAELSISINMETSNPRCIFYEITTPIRPNILVDITKVFKYKKNALKCYKSQLKITDYLRLMEGFNAYRSLTLGKGVKFAEAFWQVGSIKSKEDMKMWLSYEIPIML